MSEKTKAGICTATGAGIGAIKGGAIGVATSGVAIAVPVVVVGAVAGFTIYSLYSLAKNKKGG